MEMLNIEGGIAKQLRQYVKKLSYFIIELKLLFHKDGINLWSK